MVDQGGSGRMKLYFYILLLLVSVVLAVTEDVLKRYPNLAKSAIVGLYYYRGQPVLRRPNRPSTHISSRTKLKKDELASILNAMERDYKKLVKNHHFYDWKEGTKYGGFQVNDEYGRAVSMVKWFSVGKRLDFSVIDSFGELIDFKRMEKILTLARYPLEYINPRRSVMQYRKHPVMSGGVNFTESRGYNLLSPIKEFYLTTSKKPFARAEFRKILDKIDKDVDSMPKPDEQILFDYVGEGDHIRFMREWILKGGDSSVNGNLAIILACQKGHKQIVEILLADKRIDPSTMHYQPLHDAFVNGHEDVVDLLLADRRVVPGRTEYPVIVAAAKWKQPDLIKMILNSKNVDPAFNDYEAVKRAAQSDDILTLNHFLFDERVGFLKGFHIALEEAATRGINRLVMKLVDHAGKEPSMDQNLEANNALLIAAQQGNPKLVKLLLNVPGFKAVPAKECPLKLASSAEHEDLASEESTNVASKGHEEVIRLLLESKLYKPDAKILQKAVETGNVENIKLILANSAITPRQVFNALNTAIIFGHTRSATAIIESGHDININADLLCNASYKNNPAIFKALLQKNPSIIRELVERREFQNCGPLVVLIRNFSGLTDAEFKEKLEIIKPSLGDVEILELAYPQSFKNRQIRLD